MLSKIIAYLYVLYTLIFIGTPIKVAIAISVKQQVSPMQDSLSFNKIINEFYIQIELNKTQQISFILVQNKREQCYELKFSSKAMPSQLNLFFRDVNQLYQYLRQMQDNRIYFDVTTAGNIRIKKYVKDNSNVSFKTIELPTSPVKIKDNQDFLNLDQQFKINSQENQTHNLDGLMQRCEFICNNAATMIRNGANVETIAQKFRLSKPSVMKMFEQMKRYGRIFAPHRYKESMSRYQQDQTQPFLQMWERQMPIGPITSNMKMHGDGVRGIKKLLYVLVKQGKMQSLDQMRNYLLQRNIDRSLSSIYRYISSIKAQNPEFQGRNYTMYRKDTQLTTDKNDTTKKIDEQNK